MLTKLGAMRLTEEAILNAASRGGGVVHPHPPPPHHNIVLYIHSQHHSVTLCDSVISNKQHLKIVK